MKGDLAAEVAKGDKSFTRHLNPDRSFIRPDGGTLRLKGRALMLVRNVGHLMTTPAIRDTQGNEIPEGLMDAMITTLIALHDLKKSGNGSAEALRNSTAGSVYVVKPKMPGRRRSPSPTRRSPSGAHSRPAAIYREARRDG